MTRSLLLLLTIAFACGDDVTPAGDAGPRADTGGVDASEEDGGEAAEDAGRDASVPADAGGPDAGGGDGRWFVDVTAASGVDVVREPAEGYDVLWDRMSGGVCVIDVDGEPPLDLFFALRRGPTHGSKLYVGEGPFAYVDRTDALGLGDVGDAFGCLAFDADGDGDDDLLVTGIGVISLYDNDGGTFRDRTADLTYTIDPRDVHTSAAAGDLDGDGDLDVVVGAFERDEQIRFDPECGPAPCAVSIEAYPQLRNQLLVQDGGKWTDRAAELAPDLLALEPTLVVTVADLDHDGTPDVYVGNDIGRMWFNRPLRRGEGGVFEDVATSIGMAFNRMGHGGCTMGVSHADVNGDLVMDLVATSFEADPSGLFVCEEPGGWCPDNSREAGMDALADTLRWGAALADLDLDGWVDLVEATGHLSTDEELAITGGFLQHAQLDNLFRNRGDGTFEVVDPAPGDGLGIARSSRGIAVADLDDDGDLDLVFATTEGPMAVLENVAARRGHFLRVVLRDRPPNPGAVGARVTLVGERRSVVRERIAGEGFLGNFDPRLHFGFEEDGPVTVEVRWPDGDMTTVTDVALDTELVVTR